LALSAGVHVNAQEGIARKLAMIADREQRTNTSPMLTNLAVHAPTAVNSRTRKRKRKGDPMSSIKEYFFDVQQENCI
jgi:hypothetical protein